MVDVAERRTVPVPDRDTAPYWAALAEGRFMMQRCNDCRRWTWPARPICSGCHGADLAWEASEGTGEVYSWVVTHQPYAPDLAALVPYTITLVRLDEQDDILIPGRFVSEVEVHQGLRVRALPERVTDDVGVLLWKAAEEASMKPAAFDYHVPETVDEAVALLAELGDEAKVLAGGQSLVPMLSLRLAYFDHLVDVGRIADLRGIRTEADSVVVGSTTVDAVVEEDVELASSVPLLSRVTPLIGHFQIRNRGTVGGSIAHADPAGEYPAVALALDAEMEAVSPRGRRSIPAQDFFAAFWTTALDPDELLVGVRFPTWTGRCGFAVREFARRFGDFAVAGAVVAVQVDADDARVERAAIGLLGLGATPLRAPAAEQAAVGQPAADLDADELGQLAMSDLTEVPSDVHGPASYRRRVGAAMVSRAWAEAISEATSA